MATIFGTNGDDLDLRGTVTADAIYGYWGNDSLFGDRGRDRLYGGQGNDTLDGGAGPDLLDGGDGFDLVVYSANTTSVWADLRSGVVSFPGQRWPTETLAGIEAIDGGSGRDTFIGDGAANLLDGNVGNDTLLGNAGADTLLGGAGADSLDGGNGGDRLAGGLGDDILRGGAGNDLLVVRAVEGQDAVNGGTGQDTLRVVIPNYDPDLPGQVSGIFSQVRVNLGTGTLRLDDGPRSAVSSIERVESGGGDDSINGSTGDDFISAGDGANVVYAGSGDDTIIGGRYLEYDIYDETTIWPTELLNGGAGDDLIVGKGNVGLDWDDAGLEYDHQPTGETLVGGAGNDTIEAGPGIQTISGGGDADTFVFTDEVYYYGYGDLRFDGANGYTAAQATISDFDASEDVIRIRFDESTPQPIEWIGEVPIWPDFPMDQYQGAYDVYADSAVISIAVDDPETQYGSYLEIRLLGYTGPLSGIDIDLA